MMWLKMSTMVDNKPFSLSQVRRYLAFSGLDASTDQNGRVVVYVANRSSIGDASEMLKRVIEKNRLNTKPIPCDEQTRLFVQKKLDERKPRHISASH